jgi:hypothetical protein
MVYFCCIFNTWEINFDTPYMSSSLNEIYVSAKGLYFKPNAYKTYYTYSALVIEIMKFVFSTY